LEVLVESADESSLDVRDFAGKWVLDPDRTSIAFHTKAMWVLPVKGRARAIEGVGTVDPDGGLSGTLVVDAASLDTKNKKRDAHLRTADFFEVEKFPAITFEVTNGRLTGSGKLDLTGTLTVHGQTRPLSVTADLGVTGDAVTISTEVAIDRSEWGVSLTPFGAGLKNRVVIDALFRRA
jgi:polyisoprenoid-binding protein YceI